MLKSTTRKLKVVSLSLSLTLVVLQGCSKSGAPTEVARGTDAVAAAPAATDIKFAGTAFKALAKGDDAAAGYLDWEGFKAMGQDFGKVYKTMTTDAAKSAFRTSFINSFSKSLTTSCGNADALKNWRADSVYHEPAKTLVSADTTTKARLLLTITKINGQLKLSSLTLAK